MSRQAIKFRVSGETVNGHSTWAELSVKAERPWIALDTDSVTGLLRGVSLRAADARKLAAALVRAADEVEHAGEDFPP